MSMYAEQCVREARPSEPQGGREAATENMGRGRSRVVVST